MSKVAEEIRRTAQIIVRTLYESNLLPGVDCTVNHYGVQVIDWSKFWSDEIVKEAEAIAYLEIKSFLEGKT